MYKKQVFVFLLGVAKSFHDPLELDKLLHCAYCVIVLAFQFADLTDSLSESKLQVSSVIGDDTNVTEFLVNVLVFAHLRIYFGTKYLPIPSIRLTHETHERHKKTQFLNSESTSIWLCNFNIIIIRPA